MGIFYKGERRGLAWFTVLIVDVRHLFQQSLKTSALHYVVGLFGAYLVEMFAKSIVQFNFSGFELVDLSVQVVHV